MHRLNITIHEDLQMQATARAKQLGLSLSALIRLLLVKEVSTTSSIDQRLKAIEQEGFEPFDTNQLRKDIDNARS